MFNIGGVIVHQKVFIYLGKLVQFLNLNVSGIFGGIPLLFTTTISLDLLYH